MNGYMSLLEFHQRFPDEEACQAFIIERRWGGKPSCPRCVHDKAYRLASSKMFKCAGCRNRFSVRTGTVMEESPLPLRTWLLAIQLKTSARKGISSVQFAKDLGVTEKTAWFVAHRIRDACTRRGSPLSGDVEMDETYFGGLENNKHADKKLRPDRGAFGKIAVFGMRERGGHVIAMPV